MPPGQAGPGAGGQAERQGEEEPESLQASGPGQREVGHKIVRTEVLSHEEQA